MARYVLCGDNCRSNYTQFTPRLKGSQIALLLIVYCTFLKIQFSGVKNIFKNFLKKCCTIEKFVYLCPVIAMKR